jgi:hypothetical protein
MPSELIPKRREVCDRLATCVFFANLALPAVAETLKSLYCRGNYSACARYQLAQSGQTVPLDLWPNGTRV